MNNNDNNVIYQYIRNRRRQKVGVVLAKNLSDSHFGIGWSLCNPKDNFNKNHAIAIANGRADKSGGVDPIPYSIMNDVAIIYDRAVRYFKGASIRNDL